MTAWSIDDLGEGTHLFHWHEGDYTSPFVVARHGVIAIDPINPQAAAAYRTAIERITPDPIRAIIYSHDHHEHIAGAASLDSFANVYSHPRTAQRIAQRKDPVVVPPDVQVDDGDVIRISDVSIPVRWFGRGHSTSNLALYLPIRRGILCYYCDVIEEATVPYRGAADTDYPALLRALNRLDSTKFNLILGGHSKPVDRVWVGRVRAFLQAIITAVDEVTPQDAQAQQIVMERLRPEYGAWAGFEEWVPVMIDRITGR